MTSEHELVTLLVPKCPQVPEGWNWRVEGNRIFYVDKYAKRDEKRHFPKIPEALIKLALLISSKIRIYKLGSMLELVSTTYQCREHEIHGHSLTREHCLHC